MTDPTDTSLHDVVHIYMRDYGRFLSTRESGQAAASDFRRITRNPGDVILDFDGVEAATPPYLKELFDAIAALILANRGDGRIVLAAHLNPDLDETMRYVAAHAKQGVVVAHGRQLDLLEDRPHLVETLREAQSLQPFFTAPELAERLNIQPDTATQRLKELVEIGAAERRVDPASRRGKRHIYRVADPRSADPDHAARRPRRRRRAPQPAS